MPPPTAVLDRPDAVDQAAVQAERRRTRHHVGWLLVLVLLPFAVAAAVLVFDVGRTYVPASDHALIEMQVRDIGDHPVLTGLYSRDQWSHPGPAQFVAMAPFYWLTNSASVGTFLGALAINGVAIGGMALLAWRRGGMPLLLVMLLGTSLLVRTLGPDFVRDPWNCFVTVLPWGLLVLLAWSMACGEAWALPLGVAVTSFVAQTHVGFMALGIPLLGLGAVWLAVSLLRDDDRLAGRRRLVRAGLVAAAIGVVAWAPPLLDVLIGDTSNAGRVLQWFRAAEGGAHTVTDGLRVLSAQFDLRPEWLTAHRAPTWYSGEPVSLYEPSVPWLALPVVVAAALLWRRRGESRALAVVVAVTIGLGVLALARTVGPMFDYRVRWLWILGLLSFVAVAWAAWHVVHGRWAGAGRVLGPVAVAGLVVLTGVNSVAAAGAGTPFEADSDVLASLTPGVMEAIGTPSQEVLVTDTLAGSWYARGVVLELERRGVPARVPAEREELFGGHRVHRGGPLAATLFVAVNDEVRMMEERPDMRLLAEWSPNSEAKLAAVRAEVAELDRRQAAGEFEGMEHAMARRAAMLRLWEGHDATEYAVAVFLDERAVEPPAGEEPATPGAGSPADDAPVDAPDAAPADPLDPVEAGAGAGVVPQG